MREKSGWHDVLGVLEFILLPFIVLAAVAQACGCSDDAPPVPADVLDAYPSEVVECLVDDDCTDSGRFERFCVACVCVRDRTHFAPCWKLGGGE